MRKVRTWTITVTISEDQDRVLSLRDTVDERREPSKRTDGGTAAEPAIAGALAGLASRVLEVTAGDLGKVTPRSGRLLR